MNTDCFPLVSNWIMPRSALSDSAAEMRKDGEAGDEGIVLWLGHRDEGLAEVTHLVILRGPDITKSPVNIRIQSRLINSVTDLAMELGVVLVGQIHSHGPGFGTDLSPSDRAFGFAFPGYLSVVAPDYAKNKTLSLNKCGVFLFERGVGFRRLRIADVKQRVKIVSKGRPVTITVGENNDNA